MLFIHTFRLEFLDAASGDGPQYTSVGPEYKMDTPDPDSYKVVYQN